MTVKTGQAMVTVLFLERDPITFERRTMVLRLWDDELTALVEAVDGRDLVHLMNEHEETYVQPCFIREIKVERGAST